MVFRFRVHLHVFLCEKDWIKWQTEKHIRNKGRRARLCVTWEEIQKNTAEQLKCLNPEEASDEDVTAIRPAGEQQSWMQPCMQKTERRFYVFGLLTFASIMSGNVQPVQITVWTPTASLKSFESPSYLFLKCHLDGSPDNFMETLQNPVCRLGCHNLESFLLRLCTFVWFVIWFLNLHRL